MSNFKDINNWEQELYGHPAFMEAFPPGGEVSDAVAALQAMKYDDDDDTPEDKARIHKTDGNKYFKLKKYKFAMDSYTEGIGLRCADLELNAELYGNRAACHVRIGNYRSAFKDCFMARKFNPAHLKVLNRGIDCLMKLLEYDLALEWISLAKSHQHGDSAESTRLQHLEEEVLRLQKVKNRNERKEAVALHKTLLDRGLLLSMLEERHIQLLGSDGDLVPFHSSTPGSFDMDLLNVDLPPSAYDDAQVRQIRVSVAKTEEGHVLGAGMNCLVWPVVFMYPEFNETDFIQQFDETDRFELHLSEMFAELPAWDVSRAYQIENLSIYFESGVDYETVIEVPLRTTLKSVLSDSRFRLKSGLPGFIVLSSRSEFSVEYLKRLRVKNM